MRRKRGTPRSAAVCGDPSLFAAVFDEHHQALYRYCRSILAHDEDAQDALQNTMTRAFAALETEKRDFELRPWLFRIAHNESISLLRARRPSVELDTTAQVGNDTLERQLSDRSELATLRSDLRDLPEAQRAALVMRELSGLSHEEIALALERPSASVKQLIYEARASLHVCREGRALACDAVRRIISDDDGRSLRGRAVRAHLRGCPGCRDFAAAVRRRPEQLALLAPPLPVALGGALLSGLLPTGNAAAAGLGATSSAAATGALGAKLAVSVVLAASAASGVAAVVHQHHVSRRTAPLVKHLLVTSPDRRSPSPRGSDARPGPSRTEGAATIPHRRVNARSASGADKPSTDDAGSDVPSSARGDSAVTPVLGMPRDARAGRRRQRTRRSAARPQVRRSPARSRRVTPTRHTKPRPSHPAAGSPATPSPPAARRAPAKKPDQAAAPAAPPAPATPPADAHATPPASSQPPAGSTGRSSR